MAKSGHQGQRHRMGHVRSDNADRRKFRVKKVKGGDAQRAGADRRDRDQHAENGADGDGDLAQAALAQRGIVMPAGVVAQLAAEQNGDGGQHEGETKAVGDHGTDRIAALGQLRQDVDGDRGGRDAAEGEAAGDRPLDVPFPAVRDRAAGLG